MNESAACTLVHWLLLKTAMSNNTAAQVHRGPLLELRQFCVDEIMSGVAVVMVVLLEEWRFW